jgi:hypothetical protein
MTRTSLRLFIIVGIGSLGLAAPSVAQAACTGGSTLNGYYGLEVNGQTPSAVGKFLNGVVYFNGSCALQANVTIGENSSVNAFANFNGTYNTNPDNTISISFTLPGASTPETYVVGYSPIFNEATGVETDSSATASIDLKAQNYPASGNHNVYNNASLKGTWAATCTGINGDANSDLNYISFDGSTSNYGVFGNVTGLDDTNDSAQYADLPLTGEYGVNPVGDFGGYSVVGSTTVGFSGVIDNNLNEIQYNVSTAGSNGADVEACVAKRVK